MQAGIQCMVQVRAQGPCKVVGRRPDCRRRPAVVPGLCMVAVLLLDCQWRAAGLAEVLPGFPVASPMANLPSRTLRTMIKPAVKRQSFLDHSEEAEASRR